MSQKTFTTLVTALEAHMQDEGTSVLTDWYIVAAGASMTEADSTMYMHLCSDSPYHSLLGMVMTAKQKLDRQISIP